MRPRRVALRSARLAASLLCLTALACSGETRVSLLDPIVERRPDSGVPEAGARDAAPDGSVPNNPHLIHRYSFSGVGPEVIDSIGGQSGTLVNGAELDGAGHVVLDGDNDFVNLPSGLISGLGSATLFGWLSWNGGGCWQRVFDFGDNDHTAGAVGNATSSVSATPLRCPSDVPTAGPGTLFELTPAQAPSSEVYGSAESSTKFPVLQNTSMAVVLDPATREMRLFVSGKLVGAGKFTTLSAISDVNDWLGRSQWVQDIALRGSIDEFRIYDDALDDASVAAIDVAGPDAP